MEIGPPRRSEATLGELKIKLPAHIRITLHRIKLLHGVYISETVTIAIERYLASLAENGRERATASQPSTP